MSKPCARCGSESHAAASCPKPFYRSQCSVCKKTGHVAEDCFVARNATRMALQKEWEARVAEREAQKKRAQEQAAERRAAWESRSGRPRRSVRRSRQLNAGP